MPTKKVTFRQLQTGERFTFVGGAPVYRICTKVDDQVYAFYDKDGGTLEEQESVTYGRVGVGDNPVVRVE